MKSDIHPKVHDVVFMDTSTGTQFISQSTNRSDEKVKINGKEYFVLKVETSSASHPFYTGKQKLMDSTGRVDKFMAKMKKAQEQAAKTVKKVKKGQEKKAAKDTAEEEEDTVNE